MSEFTSRCKCGRLDLVCPEFVGSLYVLIKAGSGRKASIPEVFWATMYRIRHANFGPPNLDMNKRELSRAFDRIWP
jgi:hypothetical protein